MGGSRVLQEPSPKRPVFYLNQINFTTTRIQVCQEVPSNLLSTVEFDSV